MTIIYTSIEFKFWITNFIQINLGGITYPFRYLILTATTARISSYISEDVVCVNSTPSDPSRTSGGPEQAAKCVICLSLREQDLSQCDIIVNYDFGTKSRDILIKMQPFSYKKIDLKMLRDGSHFVSALVCWYAFTDRKLGIYVWMCVSYLKIPLKMAIFRIALNTYLFMYSCISCISMFVIMHFSFFYCF